MTIPRFTNQELYSLRNDIPVDALIEKALGLPCRVTEGHFRFLCPSCKEFHTAVNPETNLARCFGCEENFNTIDLAMIVRKSDFVESVRFLQGYQKRNSATQSADDANATVGATHEDAQIKHVERSERSHSTMVHIGHILDHVVPPKRDRIQPDTNRPAQHSVPDERISRLEQKLDRLSHLIEKILIATHIDNPSRQ
jgi:DNA primase